MITAAGANHQVDLQSFVEAGCSINFSKNFEVMKSPIGDSLFCSEFANKRVAKAERTLHAIADLPDTHCALKLLRYQVGRLNYLVRTTPRSHVQAALQRFDSSVRDCFDCIMGRSFDSTMWEQAVLPVRESGLGLTKSLDIADAAYCASRAAMRDLGRKIYPDSVAWNQHPASHDPLSAAIERLNAVLPQQEAYSTPADDEEETKPARQQTLTHAVAQGKADLLRNARTPLESARLYTYSAPGCSRWLDATPSPALDKYFTSNQILTIVGLQLGVDVVEGWTACRLCGMTMDTKGIHCLSCTVGGDLISRHNDVRDLLFKFASRGQFNPILEKACLLQEPGVFLQMRRPADVLLEVGTNSGSNRSVKVALDVKVINALGPDHLQSSMGGATKCLEAYREHALQHNQTADRCRAQGVVYEPVVFSCQGGCERHAEAAISRIASGIAKAEGISAAVVKAELFEEVSFCLARHATRSLAKRMPLHVQRGNGALWRCVDDATREAANASAMVVE